ncbi:phosphoglycerate mutase-like protein 1 isoform X1 [Cucumis melo var. makuwa]|uniref:Phosphoglycerate mutase-like protein 1 isoform X1 n=1 Tax=Cucumis melo var. makuwa TaxID=1194695 RepID=A0A5D3E0J6_CUCMM|nr:phosphoglycerate mutase-like protein 1 isoform X1 [Cucumis melo var. makuwa]
MTISGTVAFNIDFRIISSTGQTHSPFLSKPLNFLLFPTSISTPIYPLLAARSSSFIPSFGQHPLLLFDSPFCIFLLVPHTFCFMVIGQGKWNCYICGSDVYRLVLALSNYQHSTSGLWEGFDQNVGYMDNGAGLSLYPLHRCKTIHLVRHAQGIHNVDGDKSYKAYMRPEFFDAHITQLGWQQIDNLRKHVHASGLSRKIDLVVTSPLLRTLQTAVGVFGGDGYTPGMDVLPLMIANAGNSARAAISSLNCPPIAAVELCREHLGVHPCDKRRNISDYQFLFPAVDFSLIESDEDVLWKADIRETKEELAARGLQFLNWLWTRKEKEIAVVTHSGFLFHTLTAFGNDCHPLVKKEICKHFANCELRSIVIVDRSMVGSDSSTTNYPGKVPSGLDIPSDAVDDNSVKEDKQPIDPEPKEHENILIATLVCLLQISASQEICALRISPIQNK